MACFPPYAQPRPPSQTRGQIISTSDQIGVAPMPPTSPGRPQPRPCFYSIFLCTSARISEHQGRVLQIRLPRVGEASERSPVHDAVVGRPRNREHPCRHDLVGVGRVEARDALHPPEGPDADLTTVTSPERGDSFWPMSEMSGHERDSCGPASGGGGAAEGGP